MILLDECLPRKLKFELSPHTALTVTEVGWPGVRNGALLRLAEGEFDLFLTVDRNLRHQQNIADYDIAIIVVTAKNNKVETLRPLIRLILEEVEAIRPGTVVLVGNYRSSK